MDGKATQSSLNTKPETLDTGATVSVGNRDDGTGGLRKEASWIAQLLEKPALATAAIGIVGLGFSTVFERGVLAGVGASFQNVPVTLVDIVGSWIKWLPTVAIVFVAVHAYFSIRALVWLKPEQPEDVNETNLEANQISGAHEGAGKSSRNDKRPTNLIIIAIGLAAIIWMNYEFVLFGVQGDPFFAFGLSTVDLR
jgi:hypothetical protein